MKKYFPFIVIALLFPFAANAVTLDATSTKVLSNGFSAAFSSSTSFTVSSTGQNCVLYMANDYLQDVAGTGLTTAATFNGVAMTKVVTSTRTSNVGGDVWRLINPATGTHNASTTITGNTDAVVMQLWSLCNVNTVKPENTTSTHGNSNTTSSVLMTAGSSTDFMFDTASQFAATNPLVSSTGQVGTFNIPSSSASSLATFGSYSFSTTTAASTTLSWQWTTGGFSGMQIGIDVNSTGTPSGGGATAIKRRRSIIINGN